MKQEKILPPEIWEMILRYLGKRDRCNLSLVSTSINKVLSNPNLWSNVILSKWKIREEGILTVFKTRFKKFKSLDMCQCRRDEYIAIFEYLASAADVDLENIVMDCNDMSEVPPHVMAKALVRVKSVVLYKTSMTLNQWISLFCNIILAADWEVDAGFIEPALAIVKSVKLTWNKTVPRRLEHLDLTGNDLREVDTDLIGPALAVVKSVNLSWAKLFTKQWLRFFEGILSVRQPVLEVLDLRRCSFLRMRRVQSRAMGRALSRVKCIKLFSANLTTAQWSSLFKEMSSVRSAVVEIDLSYADLRQVPSDELSRALARTRNVKMSATKLTTAQWQSLLREIYSVDPVVVELLDLRCTDLRRVPVEQVEYLETKVNVVKKYDHYGYDEDTDYSDDNDSDSNAELSDNE